MHTTLSGQILTATGWVCGYIQFSSEDGRITAIEPDKQTIATSKNYILPGFIDLHVHGGGGADTMEGGEAIVQIARTHARFGTTALLATTMTAPDETITCVLHDLGQAFLQRKTQSARLLGVHLEGPYLSAKKLGAQPHEVIVATQTQIDRYRQLAPIKLVTLAPEVVGHLPIITYLVQQGIRVQLGHSDASYEEGVQALAHGACGFTHLYNAMSGFHHRAPGLVGAALAHADYAELIPDLLHVHPGAIRAALRAIPHLYGVTDATAAAGMPDGQYHLGSQTVFKCLGGVRLADGTLAGSTLTMDQAWRNLVNLGVSVEEASYRLSRYPADYLGIQDRGRLAVGSWADIVVINPQQQLQQTYVEGERIELDDV